MDEGDPLYLECHISRFKETFVSIFDHQSGKADELSAQGKTGSERPQEHAGMQPRRGARGRACGHGPSVEARGGGCLGPKGEAEQTSEANACLYTEARPQVHCTPDHILSSDFSGSFK